MNKMMVLNTSKFYHVNGFTNVLVNKVYVVHNLEEFNSCMSYIKGTIKEIDSCQADLLVKSGIQFDEETFTF